MSLATEPPRNAITNASSCRRAVGLMFRPCRRSEKTRPRKGCNANGSALGSSVAASALAPCSEDAPSTLVVGAVYSPYINRCVSRAIVSTIPTVSTTIRPTNSSLFMRLMRLVSSAVPKRSRRRQSALQDAWQRLSLVSPDVG